jgi:hypothetical protein
MSDLIQLTDAEIDLVSGGNPQINIADIDQHAVALNIDSLTFAIAGDHSTAVAVGAAAVNVALVRQRNS